LPNLFRGRSFPFQVPKYLIGDSSLGFEDAFSFAIETGFGKQPVQVGPRSFSSHFNQPQIRHLKDIGLGLVFAKHFFEDHGNTFSVGFFFHINEIDDNEASDIPES